MTFMRATTSAVKARRADASLRVAFLVDEFPVLSETFVINLAAGLVERGHDLRILVMQGRRAATAEMHGAVARARLMERVSYPVGGRLLIRSFPDTADRSRARRVCGLLSRGVMSARHARFDIAHAQFATLGLVALGLRRIGALRARRLVVHVRGFDVSRFVRERGRDVYRRLFAAADLIVANCDYFRQRAIDLGAPPARTTVIGSPVDCSLFAPKEHAPRSDGRLRLISVGRLVEKKGFEDAIRGAARLKAEGVSLSYDLIGDGPLAERFARLIKELGADDSIRLLGRRPHEDVVAGLRGADVMIAPSVVASDGDEDAPVNTLKEAMAVGLPVIATRHGGIPELVEDSVHGYLVPERDPSALAGCLRRLAAEPERWPTMGAAGRRKVVAEYDLPVIAERTIETYRRLLVPGAGP